MSTICATKRDLERIAKKRYVFDEQLFNVYIISKGNTALNLGQEYSIKKEGDYYYLYNLLSNTGCYLDPLISIDIVCEDFDVLITNEVVSKPARGRLILKNHLYDKTTTKDEVESSDCTIKPEFLDIVSEFTDNRIIQELYIGEPINASVWYDSRYLDIVRINESFFFPTKNAGDYTGLADRTGSDKYGHEQLKDLARSTFICKVGDYLKIKNISEKTIVLQKILSYDSYSELLITNYVLSPNEYFDFAVREDCFVVFNILNLQGTLDGYWLTSSCPSDYNFKLTANGDDITNTKKFVSKSLAVSLLTSISNYYIYDEKEKIYYLNDGVGDKVLENILITITGTKPDSSNVFTSSDSFTDFIGDLTFGTSFIPTSDCHITVTVKFTTDSGDFVLENDNGSSPGYTLYIQGNVPVTINNKTYSPESSVLFESDLNLTASWSLDSELYEVLLQYYINKYYLKNYLTESKSISFDMISDLILTVNTVSADCIYNADKKVILQLDFEPENSVKLHKTFNNKTHVIDTENQIYSSSMPNEFLNSDITSISYYTDKEQFAVTSKAFKDCVQLNTVSIEGPALQINNEAFKNTTALNEVKGIENTLFLGNLAFYNSGLKLFHSSNTNLTTINLSAFEECNRLLKVLLNELNLASIRESAFKNTSSLVLVKLPKSVNNIKKEAFAYSGINKIVTSDLHSFATDGFWFVTDDKTNGLSVIEEGVFKGCTNLKDIELPNSIEHLETLSFAECDNIQNFSSPGLKTIALEAFKDTWIEGIKADGLIEIFSPGLYYGSLYKKSDTSGILFDECITTLGGLKKGYTIGTYILPDPTHEGLILYKCNSIHLGSLAGCTYCIHPNTYHVASESFLGTGNGIRNYPFELIGWYNDTTQQLITFGNSSFSRNNHLTTFTLPLNGSLVLGKETFSYCKNLTTVFTRHCLVSNIPEKAFAYCGSLIPLNFVDLKVKDIADYAFDGSIRHAFDKYNALCWVQNIVLLVSSVVYTFVTLCKMDMMLNADLEVDLEYYEYEDKVENTFSNKYSTNPERYGEHFSGYASLKDAENALTKILDGLKADLQGAISSNGIVDPRKYNKFKVGDKVYYLSYTRGEGKSRVYFNGSSWAITGLPVYCIRTIASRELKKVIKGILKQTLPKIVDFVEKVQPYISGTLSVLNFAEVLKKMRLAVWQAYGYPVEYDISIPSYGFAVLSGVGLYANRGVYDVIFPETLTSIGKYAFRNCKDLKSIGFLNCPCIILEGSFYDCEFLSNVKVYLEVEQDGEQGLEENIYGYDIDSIGKYAFYHCDLFTNNINQLIENASVVEEYAFAKNRRMSVKYSFSPDVDVLSNASYNQLLVIPKCLTTIGAYAFSDANFIQFTSNSPQDLNIDSTAFDPIYDDNYNAYLGNMDKVFVVPELYISQYILRFKELNLRYDYIFAVDADNKFVSI